MGSKKGTVRPVVLLIDSVSSHINLDIFTFAKEHNIELYRLIPNATHFLQPLDNGVFGPLKKVWYEVLRQYTRENSGKENFAAKLNEAVMLFYKPLTVMNSFKSTSILPVDRSRESCSVASSSMPSTSATATETASPPVTTTDSTACTDTAINLNPGECNIESSLSAENCCDDEKVSPFVKEALIFPTCSKDVNKRKRKSTDSQPNDCLTSSETIRKAALKQLEA
ncbi:hypothetical protein MAR_013675, partial [Mya arenaria]